MKLYKLTDQNGNTKNNTHWDVGVTHEVSSEVKNPTLCTDEVIHAYKNINLAYLLNPIHADIDSPILWECDGDICVEDYGKVGCYKLTANKKLSTPKWIGSKKEYDVRIMFAILCAEQVLSIYENKYPQDDTPRKAIDAAKYYLKVHTRDAAYAADAAAYAAHAAAYAAHAAADAADAAYAAHAAHAAAYAAHAAAYAADAAAHAAANNIDFCQLANIAVNTIMK
jgi:hypothetical protein